MEEKKRGMRERESLHTGLLDGKCPSPSSFTEV